MNSCRQTTFVMSGPYSPTIVSLPFAGSTREWRGRGAPRADLDHTHDRIPHGAKVAWAGNATQAEIRFLSLDP
jgi:hypothetical protein